MADQAEPAVEPVTTETTDTPASPWAGSPWADKLDGLEDGLTREQVHELWQSDVQPYVTRKEQELGQVAEVWDGLWDDDQTIPTYLGLAESIYGPELASEVAATFAKHFEMQGMSPEEAAAEGAKAASEQAADESATPEAPPEFEDWLKQQPEPVQEMLQEQYNDRQDAEYARDLEQLAGHEPTIKGNEDRFSNYVGAAEGDYDTALARWQAEMAPVIREHPEAFGWEDPAKAAEAAKVEAEKPAKEAPAVLGTGGAAGSSVPPQVPHHNSMEEGMDAMFKALQKSKGSSI